MVAWLGVQIADSLSVAEHTDDPQTWGEARGSHLVGQGRGDASYGTSRGTREVLFRMAQPKGMVVTVQQELKRLGGAAKIDNKLRQYRRSASGFSARHRRLLDLYPKQWVAVHRGTVRARGASLSAVLSQVDQKKLPRDEVLVRFLDKQPRKMIL